MSRLGAVVDRLEEAFMAVALAFMTIVTFVQVVPPGQSASSHRV